MKNKFINFRVDEETKRRIKKIKEINPNFNFSDFIISKVNELDKFFLEKTIKEQEEELNNTKEMLQELIDKDREKQESISQTLKTANKEVIEYLEKTIEVLEEHPKFEESRRNRLRIAFGLNLDLDTFRLLLKEVKCQNQN